MGALPQKAVGGTLKKALVSRAKSSGEKVAKRHKD